MTTAVASLALVGVLLPHLMRLDRARPVGAATLWLAALTIRALASVSLALYVLLVFPDTSLYRVLTHWCAHAVAPLVGMHVDLQGHTIGAIVVLMPTVAATGAVLVLVLRVRRASRSVQDLLESGSLGTGPEGSVIVGGPDVFVGAAGLVHPRVVVSAGALATLDDEELTAGLAHEQGHIVRRHQLLLAYAGACGSVARWTPGTRRVLAELRFQLERDADSWAVRHHADPRALASAICKAATARPMPTVVGLGGGALARRVDELLTADRKAPASRRPRAVDTAAVAMVCLTLSSAVALPAEALAGAPAGVVPHVEHHCPS